MTIKTEPQLRDILRAWTVAEATIGDFAADRYTGADTNQASDPTKRVGSVVVPQETP